MVIGISGCYVPKKKQDQPVILPFSAQDRFGLAAAFFIDNNPRQPKAD
jgi:hypothetical protein